MKSFEEELAKIGLTPETYELACQDIDAKIAGENDMDWSEIKDKYGIQLSADVIRKANGTLFGGAFRAAYERERMSGCESVLDCQIEHTGNAVSDIDGKISELRKERYKLQTENLERSRLDRSESRQELYFEKIGNMVNTLPLPEFHPIPQNEKARKMNYVVGIADIHYGSVFKSLNNEYSPDIAKQRLSVATSALIQFVHEKGLSKIYVVSLGDMIQGLLRLNDLKVNDSSVVKSVVDVCHCVAWMLNTLSGDVNVEYYHTPTANHTQIRALGAKANELASEDLEYLMGHYIADLCADNHRINVHLANEGQDFIELHIPGNVILAMHGHQLKNIETAAKDVSIAHRQFYNAVMIGHYHNGREIPSYEGINGDTEILVCPSIVGSDPYADTLSRGSKAAVKVYGFDSLYGHTETYKFILN